MTYNVLLEDLVHELGGCGPYQWLLSLIVHLGKTVSTWSMITMTFAGQNSGFWCQDNVRDNGTNYSSTGEDQCKLNGTENDCSSFTFDTRMNTVVSEWDLVCDDRKWIVAMITTIQMAGVLVGCFICGHMADLVGRKPTYFLSILIQVGFNVAAYFSQSWEVYAAMRFLIGLGIGFYLTVQYMLTIEFAASKWRPAIVAMPSWALEAGVFALVAWQLHDWRKIHLAIAIFGAPFLLTWWFVPESFRWLVTKKRFDEAEKVIESIAKVNSRDKPDVSKVIAAAEDDTSTATKHYSAIDLFRTKEYTIKTLVLLFIWFAASYGYYGITFGVKSLSGDLYMNMFLINIVEAPATFTVMFLVNRFGRKKICFCFYVLSGVAGLVVGIFQYIESPISGQVTNIIALVAKLGVACGWQAMIIFTTELYPTVIRTIAYGVHSTAARLGGMVAPQIVFLDDDIPGILYFLSGVLMILSAGLILILKETKDKVLEDVFFQSDKDVEKSEGNSDNVLKDVLSQSDKM